MIVDADHGRSLTWLPADATHVIDSANMPAEGRCLHCRGTGTARPLWESRSANLAG